MPGRHLLLPTPALLATAAGWRWCRDRLVAAPGDPDRASEGASEGASESRLLAVPGLDDDALDTIVAAAVHDRHQDALARWEGRHRALAAELGAPTAVLDPLLGELSRHLLGVAMLAGIRPATHARVRSLGAALVARLFAAWAGVPEHDPRAAVVTRPAASAAHYLAARPGELAYAELPPGPVVVPAGTGTTSEGELVLLAGGAPAAAALLAEAFRLDGLHLLSEAALWSGPPAWLRDPRVVPRIERRELRAAASLGLGSVPVAALDGTRPVTRLASPAGETEVVEDGALDPACRLVLAREGLTLLAADAPLADLDGVLASVRTPGAHQALLDAAPGRPPVGAVATADLVALTLVGRGSGAWLLHVGAALEAVGQPRVRLLVLGADDRTLSLVVEQRVAEPLARALHARLGG